MLPILLFLFIVGFGLELYLLLKVGAILGPTTTFLLILLTGLIGASLAKRQGLGVLLTLQHEMARGLPPAQRVVEGVLVVAGGLLLVLPGLLGDAVGLILLIPPSRRAVARYTTQLLATRFDVHTVGFGPPPAGHPGAGPMPRSQAHTPAGPRRANPFSSPFDDLP